jgi:hypothetical protein
MEEIQKFIENFIKEEYDCWKAAYTERDTNAFLKKVEGFKNKFYGEDIYIDIRRRKNVDEEWFEEAIEYLRGTQKRLIFQIKKYEVSDFDFLYAVYLSSTTQSSDSYFEMLLVTQLKDELKVITSCLTDHEGYFDYHDGVEFEKLPEPIEILKLMPPNDSADLREYNEEQVITFK